VELPRPVVDVIFAGSDAVGAEVSQCKIWRPGGVELRVRVKHCLVGPELEQDNLVRIEDALKDLVLRAARFLLHGAAAVGHGLREFGTLPRRGVRGDDETDRHGPLLSCCS
jgi:hypothetical protein